MKNLQNFDTFINILESQSSYKENWKNVGFFTVNGNRHQIKDLIDRGDHYGIVTTEDKIFNSKFLDSMNNVEKEEKTEEWKKPRTPREVKEKQPKKPSMTTREYIKMCKDMMNSGNKDIRSEEQEGEDYNHSEIYDMAEGAVTTDELLRDYLRKKIERENPYSYTRFYPSDKECIEQMVIDMESFS